MLQNHCLIYVAKAIGYGHSFQAATVLLACPFLKQTIEAINITKQSAFTQKEIQVYTFILVFVVWSRISYVVFIADPNILLVKYFTRSSL